MAPRPPLNAETRKRLGLPLTTPKPYPWALAVLLVVLGVGPLWLATYHRAAVALVVIGLIVLPVMQWVEHHEKIERERLYLHGNEGHAVIIEIEPPSDKRNDHRVRLEVFAGGQKIRTTVVGCPLARQGIGPGDEVRVAYDPRDPRRCLILGRSQRAIVDAVFD